MKRKCFVWVLCCAAVLCMMPASVHADSGPKPSVRIRFQNMGDELCYGTLLSKTDSTGPASAWDGNPEHAYYDDLDEEIWQAFVDYEDADGYYFLQEGWLCSESKQLNWTYYPPSSFKILLYYPQTDSYVVSGIYERYAFDSYFTVDMSAVESGASGAIITAEKSYDFTWELISMLCRAVLTIALEMALAWCFGLRGKRTLRIVLCVNVVTQIALNVALNVINYNFGLFAFIAGYILLELMVFAVEAVIYVVLLRTDSRRISRRRIVAYALTANVVSFAAGMGVAQVIPGIF